MCRFSSWSSILMLLPQSIVAMRPLADPQNLRPIFHLASLGVPAPVLLCPDSSELLDENRHIGFPALLEDLQRPFELHLSRFRTRFAPDDHPVDALQIEVRHRADERLDREELDFRSAFPELVNTIRWPALFAVIR